MSRDNIHKRVCAIIVDYKSIDTTIEFIKRELGKLREVNDVVVVSNAVEENEKDSIKQKFDKLKSDLNKQAKLIDIHLLLQRENLGYARGNNAGVNYAKANLDVQYVLILNNDLIFPDSDILVPLIHRLDNEGNVGMVGPKVVGLDGKAQSPHKYLSMIEKYCVRNFLLGIVPSIFNKEKYRTTVFDAKSGEYDRLIGCFLLFALDDYINCGMMDEKTFLYGEEAILSCRLRELNLKTFFCETVKIIHAHGGTTDNFLKEKQKRRLEFESDAYYYRVYKNTPHLIVIISKICFELALLLKAFKKR